jgi:hypothetical protein
MRDLFLVGASARTRSGDTIAWRLDAVAWEKVRELDIFLPHETILRSSLSGGAALDSVQAYSLAEGLGLEAGDVVMSVNEAPVGSAGDLSSLPGDPRFAMADKLRMAIQQGGTVFIYEFLPLR